MAVTSIARSDEDRKQKNDRRDAARILSEPLPNHPEGRPRLPTPLSKQLVCINGKPHAFELL